MVKVNDSMAGATGYNAVANAMGLGNYQFFKELSAAISNALLLAGLSNPRLYGTNSSAGNIKENASYKDDKAVWNNITATQENWPNTQIPKSFEIEINGQKMWVHGNATEHMYDDVYAKIMAGEGTAYTNPNLYTQELMTDFYGSLEKATASGIEYNELISTGNWEFIFSPARQEGVLPVIKHAQFNGW